MRALCQRSLGGQLRGLARRWPALAPLTPPLFPPSRPAARTSPPHSRGKASGAMPPPASIRVLQSPTGPLVSGIPAVAAIRRPRALPEASPASGPSASGPRRDAGDLCVAVREAAVRASLHGPASRPPRALAVRQPGAARDTAKRTDARDARMGTAAHRSAGAALRLAQASPGLGPTAHGGWASAATTPATQAAGRAQGSLHCAAGPSPMGLWHAAGFPAGRDPAAARVRAGDAENGATLSSATWEPGMCTQQGVALHGRNDVREGDADVSSPSSDTIAAIASAVSSQSGGIAIVRVSGDEAVELAGGIFRTRQAVQSQKGRTGIEDSREWESHRAVYGFIVDPETDQVVDEVLVLPMLAPRSYTREDVVEIHTHGGLVCADRVLQLLLRRGARAAEPGEFTLRAFLNGRLDLSQAEAVHALVKARTQAAADSALAAAQGQLSQFVRDLRKECIDILAEVEARVDFDEDLPPLDEPALLRRISATIARVGEALSTAKRGKFLESGIRVAILGRPNVGKSSLLNAWTRSERAIVTAIAGTTRDVVEAPLEAGGIPIRLLDTAGIRDTQDVVEQIGVRRSEEAAKTADVVIVVASSEEGWTGEDSAILARVVLPVDSAGADWTSGASASHLGGFSTSEDGDTSRTAGTAVLSAEDIEAGAAVAAAPLVVVLNKSDLAPTGACEVPRGVGQLANSIVATSAIARVGLDELEAAVLAAVGASGVPLGGRSWALNERQTRQLERAKEALQRVEGTLRAQMPIDFCSVDLRDAVLALGQISGEDDLSEEVLGEIFSRFCIGK